MVKRTRATKRAATRKSGRGRARKPVAGRSAAASAVHTDTRRDDAGQFWTRAQVDTAVRDIVARLAGLPPARVQLATRFHDDLDWDPWFVLSVVKPVHARLHERLSDGVVLALETVGDLARYVWARMEVVP